MSIHVLATEDKTNGRLYDVEANNLKLKLLFTWHSLGRTAVWRLRVEQVLDALLFPEEVVTGHFNRFIAHKRHNDHIVRAVYEYNMTIPVILTVYYPSAERYFEGGGKFADKILP